MTLIWQRLKILKSQWWFETHGQIEKSIGNLFEKESQHLELD